jgi:hypothetical protein
MYWKPTLRSLRRPASVISPGVALRSSAATAEICGLMHPGCSTAVRRSGSIDTTRFSRFSAITTPPAKGSDPPDNDVPLPRATNGTPCA